MQAGRSEVLGGNAIAGMTPSERLHGEHQQVAMRQASYSGVQHRHSFFF
jgi:hypothetical protein